MSPTFDLTCAGMSNELDGDPDQLEHMVSVFRVNSETMDRSADNLQRLRNGANEMRSQAFSATAKKAFEVEEGVRAAAYYYKQVADAVAGFSPVLRDAQRRAPGHLDELHRAEGRKAQAASDYERARHYARNVDPEMQKQGIELASQASGQHKAAQASLEQARGALRTAANQVREANDTAASKVKRATDDAGLKDSVWDRLAKLGEMIGKALVAIAKFVWENLDTILLVLTIVSFLTPAGPVLAVLKAVVKAVSLLSKVKGILGKVKEGWGIVKAVADGDLAGAGRKILGIGASIVLGKVAGKITSVAGRASGKALFSLGKDGKLTSTGTGKLIHSVVDKFGPVITDRDGTPTRSISRYIDRTTKVITDTSKSIYGKGIKLITKPIVSFIKGDSSPSSAAARPAYEAGGGGRVGAW